MILKGKDYECAVKKVRHGTGDRFKFIYASLCEADTDEVIVVATLDYILEAVKKRGYTLVE